MLEIIILGRQISNLITFPEFFKITIFGEIQNNFKNLQENRIGLVRRHLRLDQRDERRGGRHQVGKQSGQFPKFAK